MSKELNEELLVVKPINEFKEENEKFRKQLEGEKE